MEGLSLDPRMLYDQVKMNQNTGYGKKTDASMFDNILKSKTSPEVKKGELKKVCSAMESIFIDQMFKSMRKNIQKSGLINGGFAEEVFNDMLYTEYSQKMAETDKFGLGKMLYDSLSKYI